MTTKITRTVLATLALFAAGQCVPRVGPAQADEEQVAPRKNYQLGPEDKVRIKVYEWRPSRDQIYEWTAFRATYVVNASGALSLPLLGDVNTEGLDTVELSKRLGDLLKDKMGLANSPDVTVEVLQYRPFYIVGAVDKPGEYPYRPSLTVLEAYALGGGKARSALGSVRLEREAIATRGELNALGLETQSLRVRMARLQAELKNDDKISWPAEIEARMNTVPLGNTVKQEQLVFDMRREAFQTQISALDQLQSFLEKEAVSLEKQLDVHETEVSSVKTELEMVEKLYTKGLTAAPRKLALERNMAQVDGDRLRLQSSLMRARQEISKTKISMVDLRAKRGTDISTEMQTVRARLEELKSKSDTSTNLLYETEVLAPQALAAEEGSESLQPTFKIVRRGETLGQQRTDAVLLPGDTLIVFQPRRAMPLPAEVSSETSPAPVAPTASVDISTDRLR